MRRVLGFGVFSANATFRFAQFQSGATHGWQSHRLGYLDERAFSYALAIFLVLKDEPLLAAAPHLSANPRSYTKHALRHIAKHRGADVARLRSVKGRRFALKFV